MTTVHALHGFLGRPSDWDVLSLTNQKVVTHDILQIAKPSGQVDFWKWAEKFNSEVSYAPNPSNVLLGYSMGGRLAMHALLLNPSQWQKAIIISAHTGLTTAKEKANFLQRDIQWADRFVNEAWHTLMDSWNTSEVFGKNAAPFVRRERDYSRFELANCLRHFSVSIQQDLKARIEALNIPILWIAGEDDERYSTLASTIKLRHEDSKVWIAPGVGHRVPWESTKEFNEQLRLFLSNPKKNK